jgi:hypothetical protein
MESRTVNSEQAAGYVLLVTAVLATLLMVNHPTAIDGAGPAGFVHGGLQLMLVCQCAAMAVVVRRLGFALLPVTALGFYFAGQGAGLMAATINGFAVPALLGYPQGTIGHDVPLLAWELNQALARLGVIATGIGYGLLGFSLWRNGERVVGTAGVLAGLLPATLLVVGILNMKLPGAIFAYTAQLAWLALLGWNLSRRT